MAVTVATWNINSVRLRLDKVLRLLDTWKPDVLCLQETKAVDDVFPRAAFAERGYAHQAIHGMKGYNGVAILSRLPITDAGSEDFAALGHARHVAARLPSGVVVHNLYVPAGGDIPDREANPKFGQKLDFLAALRDWLAAGRPERAIVVGDLNIAPREDDVWNHRALLTVVSHTPEEVARLAEVQEAGRLVDVTRADLPSGRLYSWWSYRAADWAASDRGRRLDHIWATADIAAAGHASRILKDARGWEQPSDHAPVLARFDLAP